MRQPRNTLCQGFPVVVDIGAAHFEKVVKGPGDQVTFLDFHSCIDGGIELLQRHLAGVVQADLDKHDMTKAQPLMIKQGLIAGDESVAFKAFQAGLGRGF